MTTFRVWAPTARRVRLQLDSAHDMVPGDGGWWSLDVTDAGAGTDYGFLLDEAEQPLPDPRSAWQPSGVHGLSRVVDHSAYPWTDADWRGISLPGSVFYELHIGTFTPEGTFEAAIDKLDHLVVLGVDVVELLPVAAFDGHHGWGYDGVDLFAVHDPYGGPHGLKQFIDACHGRGLGVVLDVVYNHLGPSGNYLQEFGPYFTDTRITPWGPAVNYDAAGSDEVRRFVIENALDWLRHYHADGLRLDAVHAIVDERATYILEEMGVAVRQLAATLRKPLFLVAETDRNDPVTITPREAQGWGLDAQWSDDFHHALHALLTGERQGYYCDFGTLAALAKTLTGAYFHDGIWSTFRHRRHGRPIDRERIPAHRFFGYLQDHDQVGNRAQGERSAALLSHGLLKVAAALVLTSPFIPMLFMGEEWGASTPWQFFTSFPDPQLGEAVRSGRRAEFAAHGWAEEDVPDPQDPATFERSKLRWQELQEPPHADLLNWHQSLIRLRRSSPDLNDPRLDHVDVEFDETAHWLTVRRGHTLIAANFSSEPAHIPITGDLHVLLASCDGWAQQRDMLQLPGASVAIAERPAAAALAS